CLFSPLPLPPSYLCLTLVFLFAIPFLGYSTVSWILDLSLILQLLPFFSSLSSPIPCRFTPRR
ncbi:hypothetical protein ASPFODRAFT_174157, partial [Aspergillus luchuensis CBS 106.47]